MRSRKKPMPVGVDDFKKLIQKGYHFVDKTRFIKDLLDNHGEVTLITRPRRFGKTLNLSMLRYFFTLEDAEENRRLFDGLDIEREGDGCMAEQGTRPLVFLTLKNVQRPTFSSMLQMLSLLMQEVYGEHRRIAEAGSLDALQAEYFGRIRARKGTEEELAASLKQLLSCLWMHHKKKPVLLLDEYDAPILSAWEHGYYEDCIGFMRDFLGAALKTNESLDFAVLTGVTRVSKESIFSGLNNLDVCSVLTDLYSDAFGFTRDEAARLMTECGREDKLPDLKRWYDGYLFGRTEIYNPWSVIKFIRDGCIFRQYWINTSGNSILQALLEHVDEERREELEGLLRFQDAGVDAIIDEGITYPDIRDNRNALYMMLLTAGYLKSVGKRQDSRGRWWCRLQIPNREVLLAYEDEILAKTAGTGNQVILFDMLDAMVSGKAEKFRKGLGRILKEVVSFHDAAGSESFYHGLMLGFSVLMHDAYRVESNRESGYGRFDIAFFPLRPGSPGVILELKSAKSEEEMEPLAKEALRQIEEKAYAAELSRQGVKDVWKYGIAFHGKKVWMEGGCSMQA